MQNIVSTKWLLNNLNNTNLVILDCSWYMPSDKKNGKVEYLKEHIIRAHYFDIDKIANSKSDLPHMLPSKNKFENAIKFMNIKNNSTIIAYSKNNIMGACRVWWMFKYFNHKKIAVLNGGFNKWKKEKKPITSQEPAKNIKKYKAKINKSWLTTYSEINKNLNNKKFLVIDGRNSKRFKGLINEPRKNLMRGNIPNSINIYWKKMTSNNGMLINKKNINLIFLKFIKNKEKIAFSCGSGVSACVLSFSMYHTLGIKGAVYDGSWAEWGKKKGAKKNEKL